jgi:hypothetical protein
VRHGRVTLSILSDIGARLHLDAEVLDTLAEDGTLTVRARWVSLTPAQLRRVIEEMFAGAGTWVYHAAPPDRPLRSLLEVIRAPWRALARRYRPWRPERPAAADRRAS